MTENLPVMILLMGEVGAGKSTFINTAAGETLAKVGNDLNPCTSTVKHFFVKHHEREVVLVDTPGFNNPTVSGGDGDVLRGIVDWLKNECPKNIQFGGIIYFYDVSQSNKPPCGKRVMTPTKLPDRKPPRVILAMVDGNSVAVERLKSRLDTIWPKVPTCQFKDTQDSAWSIVDRILSADPLKLQYIQDELGGICNTLPTQFAPKANWSFFSSLFSFKLERR